MKKRVAVLKGGRSGEHDISLRSAAAIVAGLNRDRYDVTEILIERDGTWTPGPILPVPAGNPGIDVVFPALHGTFGADDGAHAFGLAGNAIDKVAHTSLGCVEHRTRVRRWRGHASPGDQHAAVLGREVGDLRHRSEAEVIGVGRVDTAHEWVDEAHMNLSAEAGAYVAAQRVGLGGSATA